MRSEPLDRILRLDERTLPVLQETERVSPGLLEHLVVAPAVKWKIERQAGNSAHREGHAHRIRQHFLG